MGTAATTDADAATDASAPGADRERAEELRASLTRVQGMLAAWDARDGYERRGIGTAPPRPMVSRADLERLRGALRADLRDALRDAQVADLRAELAAHARPA